ncbi:homologous-pairing protein 2 homolog [Neodiprion lecontei]|uniref:Homologous-pairing protein 2 homolog n=1 Tax=Neodiprion lecontei TaxID=441921 RepID=A0A6J0BDK7_NEOLC|nr:homologous-pairing protein 2 homolog [Neodiprion lecontei]
MATNAVYQFLKVQNRPYSANDITSNLQEFSKANVHKALDNLVESKKIFEKIYGKQKVYCVVQDGTQEPEEFMRIQRELDLYLPQITSKKLELERELRSKEAELAALKSSLSLTEAKNENTRLLNSIKKMEDELETIISKNGSENFGEVKTCLLKKIENYTREYSKRKRLCAEIIESILEGFPGTKKGLYEEIGIETVDLG